MTQIPYYPADPRTRRGALIGWGVVLIVAGALAGLMGMCGLASNIFVSRLVSMPTTGPAGAPSMPKINMPALSAAMGALLVYWIAAVFLIWTGIGSCLGRRWVRPIVMVFSAMSILSGLAGVGAIVFQLILGIGNSSPAVGSAAAAAPSAAVMTAGFLAGALFLLLIAVALPAAMFIYYRKAATKETLELLDPIRRWTDSIAMPALGWAIGCFLTGLSLWAAMFAGFTTFFDRVLVGTAARIEMLAVGTVLIVGAWMCVKNKVSGWGVSLTAICFLAASAIVFAFRGDSAQLERALTGVTNAQLERGADSKPAHDGVRGWGGVLFTCAGIWRLCSTLVWGKSPVRCFGAKLTYRSGATPSARIDHLPLSGKPAGCVAIMAVAASRPPLAGR